jgi:hypothetical protein
VYCPAADVSCSLPTLRICVRKISCSLWSHANLYTQKPRERNVDHEIVIVGSERVCYNFVIVGAIAEFCSCMYIFIVMWHICSMQELWSQRNGRGYPKALEQHSFLGNGRETDNGTTSVARQHILNKQEYTDGARVRLGKYFPSATDTHATGTAFSSWSVPWCYKQRKRLGLSLWREDLVGECPVGREPQFIEDVRAEAEETPLLEAVTRKHLVTD